MQVASVTDRSSDMYLALPVEALGTQYFVMSYQYKDESKFLQGPSQFAVIATQDDTVLKITFISENLVEDDLDPDVIQDGRIWTITLQKYQTYQVWT